MRSFLISFAFVVFSFSMAEASPCSDAMRSGEFSSSAMLCEQAAATGDAEAMRAMGWLYEHGNGVMLQSYSKASEYYTDAALHGSSYGITSLGILEAEGKGTPQDMVKAFGFFIVAAERGNQKAIENMRMINNYLTAGGIGDAHRRADFIREMFLQ